MQIVPTHYGGGRTSVDFPFLAYLGYKTFGWVVVFIAVLILLRSEIIQMAKKSTLLYVTNCFS